jgi:DNA-binding ferritin-like protein
MADNKKTADFIGLLFLARDVAHSSHLNTRSYAKHKALQKFYENIIDLADSFAEAYSGRHGLIGSITLQSAKKTSNITEFLEDQLKQIEDERYDICDKSYTPLQNIIDEIIGLYLSTLYRLKFLS